MKTTKTLTVYQLEVLYRILLQRIAKGYSASQLTFLIGAAPGYVEEVETFQRPFYTGDDLQRIALALEEEHLPDLYPSLADDNEVLISVQKQEYKDRWVYTYCRIDEQNEEEVLYMLQEGADAKLDDLPEGDEILAIVVDTIDVLVRSGYFYEAKLPYEVFQSINRLLPTYISPLYICLAMDRFCQCQDATGPLRLIDNDGPAYKYEEC
jgi:transcriptional regulator with XRE-family HTH domain